MGRSGPPAKSCSGLAYALVASTTRGRCSSPLREDSKSISVARRSFTITLPGLMSQWISCRWWTWAMPTRIIRAAVVERSRVHSGWPTSWSRETPW